MQNNQIRFLVATDIHLGHRERHPIRGKDSFQAFQEVIEYTKKTNVDFLLLGGDLFDEVNPSKECFYECLNILKKNVFGHNKVQLNVTQNGKQFKSNFQNEDINISLPIFTIHGNHDYPANEFGKISICDLLHASNYVNYFGKNTSLHYIQIKPLIITKPNCTSKVAIYGLGYIKDQILNEMFEKKKVTFELPEGDIKQYVKIFVFHQNRYKKGFRAGVPSHKSFDPKNIPEWMDLVLWGHEHEAIYKVQYEYDRPIYQPGSTIITSFVQAESLKKQCILITIKENNFEIKSLLLQASFRPMYCLNYEISSLKIQFGEQFDLYTYLDKTISDLIEQSLKITKKKPIIRMKIEYSGVTDIIRYKQLQVKFDSSIANGDKMIIFWKRKQEKEHKISDEQIFYKIKNKQSVQMQTNIIDQIHQTLKDKIKNVQNECFQRQFLLDLASQLSQSQNISASDYIQRKCGQLQKKKLSEAQDNLMKMNVYKENEYKKSVKYQIDKKKYFFTGKIDYEYYKVKTPEQFLSLQTNMMSANNFSVQCKVVENHSKSEASQKSIKNQKNQSRIMPNRIPIIKRKKQQTQQNSSVEIINRSESQDCCQKAQKTKLDETGNKIRFDEAKIRLERIEIQRKKKSVPVKNEPVQQKQSKYIKKERNVRFSQDFM